MSIFSRVADTLAKQYPVDCRHKDSKKVPEKDKIVLNGESRIKKLLNGKKHVDSYQAKLNTALCRVTSHKHPSYLAARWLIDLGASPNARCKPNKSVLFRVVEDFVSAAYDYKSTMVKLAGLLVRNGADVNFRGGFWKKIRRCM